MQVQFTSVQFTFQQKFSEVVRVGFLEEISLKANLKLLATHGQSGAVMEVSSRQLEQ